MMSILSWSRARLFPGLLVIGGFVLFAVGIVDCLNFAVDDTFISLRFAENAAAGRGLVFNQGERVEGYSNFLWTLVLGVLAKLGFTQRHGDLDLLIAAKATAFAFALGTMLLTAWLAGRLAKGPGTGGSGMMSMAVLGLGGSFSFALWTMSGMETAACAFFVTLAAGLVVTALARYDSSGTIARGRFLAAGVAFGIATLIRPEEIFIWALATAGFLVWAPRRLRGVIAVTALPTLLLHAAYLLWRYEYYGMFIPNSVVAKWGPGPIYAILGAKYMFAGLIASVGVIGLGFLVLPALVKRYTACAFLATYVGSHVAFIILSGGDWMPGFRFFVPIYPLLWLLAAASLSVLLASVTIPIRSDWVAGLILVLVVGSFFASRSLVRAQFAFPTGFKQRVWLPSPDRVRTAKELRALIPSGSELALGECGYIPYFNPDTRIVDLFGLMEPKVARMPGLHMHKMTAAYFAERRPDFYLMMVREDAMATEILPTHADGETLLADADFRRSYEAWHRYPGFVLYRRRS